MRHELFTLLSISMLLLSSFSLFSGGAGKDGLGNVSEASYKPSERRMFLVPDDFERIQDAIDNSANGDVIFVRPGTYRENIVIRKSVSIIGMDRKVTVLDGERKSDVVRIYQDNVLLAGFTIMNGSFPARYGVKIFDSVNVSVQDNIFTDNLLGIELYRAASSRIRWNHLFSNRYGIFLAHSTENVVYANNVSSNRWNGIELDWSDRNVIAANTVSGNGAYGLEIPVETPARYNRILNNNFFNNTLGTRVSGYMNVWSEGYPMGGNFWGSDIGVDVFGGPGQDQPGSDGIIDTPYRIDEKNTDLYPLAHPFHPLPLTTPKADFVVAPDNFPGDVVTFNASLSTSKAEIFSFFWDFGDGARGQGANVTHIYGSSGSYLVELYAVDKKEGLWTIESRWVMVQSKSGNVPAEMATGIAAIAVVVAVAYFIRRRSRTQNFHLQKRKTSEGNLLQLFSENCLWRNP